VKGVKTIILGGGRGSRLFPLTLERAKPAVSFAGKYRLIDIPISNCINSGLKNVFVLTQFLSASLHRHIMQTYRFDTFSDGFIDVLAAEQTPQGESWFQGTADAVRATLNHTTYFHSDQMLILSGDHLYRMNYAELIKAHRESRADITLCVYPVQRSEASRMGMVRVDAEGMVEAFEEKPKDPEVQDRFQAPQTQFRERGLDPGPDRYLATMGIYVFEPHVLASALQDPARTDFGKEVIPAAIHECRVMAYPFTGYWMDIGTIGSFYEANLSLAQSDPPFRLYRPNWPLYTRTRSLPPNRIIHSEIYDSLVVEGTDLSGARISDSIIGVRGIVREGTRLDGVIMMGADFYEHEEVMSRWERPDKDLPGLGVGRDCIIERAIIDKNARIGDGVRIRAKDAGENYEEKDFWVRDGITVVPKGAVIEPGTEI
jgi:glucose-1-phosphate adenylyltransferase